MRFGSAIERFPASCGPRWSPFDADRRPLSSGGRRVVPIDGVEAQIGPKVPWRNFSPSRNLRALRDATTGTVGAILRRAIDSHGCRVSGSAKGKWCFCFVHPGEKSVFTREYNEYSAVESGECKN